jgi:hypothetical protein
MRGASAPLERIRLAAGLIVGGGGMSRARVQTGV